MKGFKDFLLRGNVVDLAVAVVMATAFTAVVTAFTTNIINPLIARIGGGGEVAQGLGIQLGADGNKTTFVDFGSVITALINFIIVAAVIYFVVVLPYETLKTRFAKPGDEGLEEKDVLLEIRDLLAGKDPQEVLGRNSGAFEEARKAAVTTAPAPQAPQPPQQHFNDPGAGRVSNPTASGPAPQPAPSSDRTEAIRAPQPPTGPQGPGQGQPLGPPPGYQAPGGQTPPPGYQPPPQGYPQGYQPGQYPPPPPPQGGPDNPGRHSQ